MTSGIDSSDSSRVVLNAIGKGIVASALACAITTPARAQTVPPPPPPFGILDNSFLVEEAFNQESGVVQNIFGASRLSGTWTATFTQEWPIGTQTHQFSYTVSYLDTGQESGPTDTLINYRFQALTEGPGRPALAPRASLILPTGSARRRLGNGSSGLQIDFPFSKRRGDLYFHWNAGVTWLPRADADEAGTRHANLASPFLAGSSIFRLRPMLNVMLESVLLFQESAEASGTTRETIFVLSPGARGGWNIGKKQVIVGAAVPVTWGGGDTNAGVFLYFSYELPFKEQKTEKK